MIKAIMTDENQNNYDQGPNDHLPVMLDEVLEYMDPQSNDIFVDGTLGMGGHAQKFLQSIGSKGLLIGMDRDEKSLSKATQTLSAFSHQCHFVHKDFRYIDEALNDLNIQKVDGIFLDLGISSYQLNNPERGFSFRKAGPLDMRMDQNGPISAYDLINSLSEKEISSILREFGEERWSNRIARLIVSERSKQPIELTEDLCRIVQKAIPMKGKPQRIHPATRTFQAIRIAVNRELETLEIAIDKCISLLNPGGRLGIISFHSLEDRIVKNKFKMFSKANLARCLVKRPLRPTEKEVSINPRARSARFRIIERNG
ncbi:MAG: 16S rRNA (cytosine(1402)-N(4))-methyltransferase RsmH [Candidatus Omnitrophica bacterium]|nr:16S rRNA (cytosine(1402)-N(4))-methyltransferase RsmH [Candidatus Omnitrophota bacterium]